jgi:hypothetical protein
MMSNGISTVTSLNTSTIAGSSALVGVFVLIALPIHKEITTAPDGSRFHQLSKTMNNGILPFMIAFILIVVFNVIEALN